MYSGHPSTESFPCSITQQFTCRPQAGDSIVKTEEQILSFFSSAFFFLYTLRQNYITKFIYVPYALCLHPYFVFYMQPDMTPCLPTKRIGSLFFQSTCYCSWLNSTTVMWGLCRWSQMQTGWETGIHIYGRNKVFIVRWRKGDAGQGELRNISVRARAGSWETGSWEKWRSRAGKLGWHEKGWETGTRQSRHLQGIGDRVRQEASNKEKKKKTG